MNRTAVSRIWTLIGLEQTESVGENRGSWSRRCDEEG